jgi:hypothetical protein
MINKKEYDRIYRLKNHEHKLAQDREYYQKHKEHIKENVRDWYANHPERCKEYAREYRKQHPEKSMEYYYRHPEKCRELVKQYRQEHPEIIKAQNKARCCPLLSYCQFGSCESTKNLQRAHLDYDYPLEVVTFCARHHHLIDKLYRRFD